MQERENQIKKWRKKIKFRVNFLSLTKVVIIFRISPNSPLKKGQNFRDFPQLKSHHDDRMRRNEENEKKWGEMKRMRKMKRNEENEAEETLLLSIANFLFLNFIIKAKFLASVWEKSEQKKISQIPLNILLVPKETKKSLILFFHRKRKKKKKFPFLRLARVSKKKTVKSENVCVNKPKEKCKEKKKFI